MGNRSESGGWLLISVRGFTQNWLRTLIFSGGTSSLTHAMTKRQRNKRGNSKCKNDRGKNWHPLFMPHSKVKANKSVLINLTTSSQLSRRHSCPTITVARSWTVVFVAWSAWDSWCCFNCHCFADAFTVLLFSYYNELEYGMYVGLLVVFNEGTFTFS